MCCKSFFFTKFIFNLFFEKYLIIWYFIIDETNWEIWESSINGFGYLWDVLTYLNICKYKYIDWKILLVFRSFYDTPRKFKTPFTSFYHNISIRIVLIYWKIMIYEKLFEKYLLIWFLLIDEINWNLRIMNLRIMH